jgi:glycosyltransferase involved in cell wall biosynthesis
MRILTVTNLYPSAAKPVHGVFVEERMTRYAARFGDELRVVAPVPWFPFRAGFGEYSRLARTPYQESRGGVPIYHPRVFIVPKVGMRLAPTAWRMRLRPMLRRLREEWRFDLIDGHYIYPDGVALVPIAAELGVPIVLSARGTDVHLIGNMEGPRQRIRDACARASAVVAVSHALARHLAEIGVPKEAISVVQNGADVDAFAPRRDRAPEKLGPGRVLLGIGRLVPQKGFHLAIQAMARLLPKYPDLQLFLAGDGAERARLEALVASLGLGARVRFLGEVVHGEIPRLLWGSDRLVLPSFREGHPNAIVEAVAAGVPVVATAIGGIPEIVDPEIGEIAERPDLESFERALDRSLSRSFDPAAFVRRREDLRWERSLDLLHRVFERAVAAGPPPRSK